VCSSDLSLSRRERVLPDTSRTQTCSSLDLSLIKKRKKKIAFGCNPYLLVQKKQKNKNG